MQKNKKNILFVKSFKKLEALITHYYFFKESIYIKKSKDFLES